MEKKCSKCQRVLSLRKFYRDSQKKDGLSSSCKRCYRKQHIISYKKRREKVCEYAKNYYQKNKEMLKKRQRKYRKELLIEIFNLLGNKCSKCGFDDKRALQIDHIGGGGYDHRKISGGGLAYYKEIINSIKNNNKEYRLLCANCNFIEGIQKGYRKSIWKGGKHED